MQQQQGGGRVQYGASPSEMTGFAAAPTTDSRAQMIGPADQHLKLGDPSMGAAEEASPISSRPPATSHFSSAANMEELLPVATGVGGLPDDDALGGDDGDRGGVSGGNRWPRQETLALLKIRSEMDAVFRDASLKGPLWEDVSRKLAELGYKRSAKKCKEKFENVHKYYKRTKEGRAGRQDGKSYRFFTQLEALHNTVISSPTPTPTPTPPTSVITTTAAATIEQVVAPVPVPVSIEIGVGNPMPVSSVRVPSPFLAPKTQSQLPPSIPLFPQPQEFSGVAAGAPAVVQSGFGAAAPLGVSFSSDSSSSSSGSEEMGDEEDDMDLEGDFMASMSSQQRKRKRGSSKQRGSSSEKMMEFFEGLMKQVMQKQETMQQRFLEAIEKREQDRMIREEAWKRQEMSRLAREQELMAQERAISATRDSAIIAFLQKITGQTIQLPQAVTVPIPAAPPPPPPQPPVSVSVPVPAPPPSTLPPPTQLYQKPQQQQPPQQHYQQQQHQVQQPPPSQQQQLVHHHQQQHPQTSEEVARTPQPPPMSSAIVVAIPEQQVAPQEMSGGGGGGFEATSSRWPKAEVLALIKLRSGLEPRYQEAGPKGPLWEEISSGMQRMGYKRNPKRCKEKWENINKYFKKVKESNKKRPEDAKTCPYFHELDALYRKKILGSPSGGNSLVVTHNRAEEQQPQPPPVMLSIQATQTTDSQNKDIGGTFDMQTSNGGLTASLFGEASDGGVGVPKKPEDIVKEQQHQQVQKHQQPLMRNGFDKIEEPDSDNLDLEEDEYNDEDEDEDDEDEDAQEEMKMAYKIQYQRPNAGSSNGGGNGAPSFLAMVQ